ncbi:5-deoxyglucuronate isomerase [Bryocella elongata]|uniref:5-deoxyglucuronate isomerase n=1 Tax=Bryocella elongata TaxID=863522 RepID=A0A1H5TG75_9BACT|nr:5-deoxy-glucuronate isomerase [Bryocella elongata]SEF61091.1 5-deoxyglucuronate isomerase [Bryocella elongata]
MNLHLKPEAYTDRAADFGFEHISFAVRRLLAGASFHELLTGRELCIVMLGGTCSITSSAGDFATVGDRATVFDGKPHALYLPLDTDYTVTATTDCDIAFCYCKAEQHFPAHHITPDECAVEIRGGGNATRQINSIIPPHFRAQRLLICEVYTPSGNWSSFPPHKHDVHNPPGEVDLDEIYYYKIDKPGGFAIQRVYTADGRLDETITVRDGELVIVPEGYHPVSAGHGYNVYYLNVLSGSARSMAASDDPDHAWVREHWTDKDPRVPLVR